MTLSGQTITLTNADQAILQRLRAEAEACQRYVLLEAAGLARAEEEANLFAAAVRKVESDGVGDAHQILSALINRSASPFTRETHEERMARLRRQLGLAT